MMKAIKVLYYASLSVSMLVGLWHFFLCHVFFDGTTIFLCNMKISLWELITQTIVFPPCCLGLALF